MVLFLPIDDSEKIPIRFRQAEDYPVDLYFLMDLSHSMLDDKEKLSHLGRILATKMQSITKNFRLGFGSFVDKNVPPFVQPAPNTYTKHKKPSRSPTYLLSFSVY